MRRAVKIALAIVAGLVLLLLLGFGLAQTGYGKREILSLIEDQLADPPAHLEAQALEGFVPFDMTLIGAKLSDAQGVWLEADRLSLSWSPAALLNRRVAIRNLSADRIAVLRAPVTPPSPKKAETGFTLPHLPVDIDLQHLAVDRLELGAAVLGEPAVFAIQAQARLGDPANGLQADLALNRIDRDLDRVTLALDYKPAADTLALDAKVAEPQGGLLTKLLGLPAKPNFALALSGSGPLTDWQAKGQATSDAQALLDLSASSKGPADDRTVAFDAKLHALPMLPADLTPLVEGGISAEGRVHITALDQPIEIETLKLETRAGALSAQGKIDPGKWADLTLDLHVGASATFASLLPPNLTWDNGTAQLQLAGPIAAPKFLLDARIANFAFQENRIGDTTLKLGATLNSEKLRADGLAAMLTASSIIVADPKLQPFLADGATVGLIGSLDTQGAITADQLSLRSGKYALAVSGSAQAWGATAAQIKGRLDAEDLAPALAFAGLQGGGKAAIDLAIDKTTDGMSANLDATASAVSLGIPEADRLIGAAPKLSLMLRQDKAGAVTIERATLDGAAVSLTVGGTMTSDRQLDLKAEAKLSDLSKVLPQASGGLGLTVTISGNAADPAANMQITSAGLQIDPVKLSQLQAAIDATNLVSAPRASIQAKAQVNALAASVSSKVDFDPQTQRISVTDLLARLGGTTAKGRLDIADGLLNGDLAFSSPALGEFGPLLGTDIGGAVEGTLALRSVSGKQNAALKTTAESLEASGVRVKQADVNASAANLFGGDPDLDATLAASGIDASGQAIDRLNAKASGRLGDLTLTADANGANAKLATALHVNATKGETRISISKLDLTANKVTANLLHPAEIALQGGNTKITGLAIGARGGTAEIDADLGADHNQASITLKQMPTSLMEIVQPDLHLLGTIDGTLHLDGPKTAPNADITLKGRGLGVAGASAQLADLDLDGTWRAGQFSTKGHVALAKSGGLDLSAALPMAADPATGFPALDPAAPLTARAKGDIDLGIVNAFIPGGADHVAGQAALDLSVAGAVARPELAGKVTIANGRYENQRYGTRLQQLTATLEGSGSKLRLVSLSAKTPGGGSLGGTGDLDFSGAMPVTISIQMKNARVINAAIGTAVTDGALQIKGTMRDEIALTGKVTIVKAEIRIPDRLPVDVEEIQVKEINLPAARQAEVDAAAAAPPPKSVKIGLDLDVSAPEQVFVRGRGLDAEMGGALKIGGTADLPIITGALKLRRGDFNLLSQRLQFNRGNVTFSGGAEIDPVLDFVATSKLTDTEVTVTVSGTATKPKIELSSTPTLPQDEILARLLFGKASGALSPFEAVQLAQATAELAGVDAGPGVLDKLRKGLGLDRLDIESGEGSTTGPSLSAGRYVSRGVFVGAKQGTQTNSSAATVEIEVTPNIKVESDVGADSTGKAGINFEWNY